MIPFFTLLKSHFRCQLILDECCHGRLAHVAKTNSILTEIGGILTEEEAPRLILKKLYDLAHSELNRYLNAEKRELIRTVENLWEKYAVSSRELEDNRTGILKTLNGFLDRLGYSG